MNALSSVSSSVGWVSTFNSERARASDLRMRTAFGRIP
jgi:hypothetical protein